MYSVLAADAGPARTSAAAAVRPTASARIRLGRHVPPRRVAVGPYEDSVRCGGGMGARKASEVFVECLEAEGVRNVFGIPGEETLDLERVVVGFVVD
jgi:hypothetical protein